MPDIRAMADKDAFNAVLDAMATFREVHYGWAEEYINRRTGDPRGTGGTTCNGSSNSSTDAGFCRTMKL